MGFGLSELRFTNNVNATTITNPKTINEDGTNAAVANAFQLLVAPKLAADLVGSNVLVSWVSPSPGFVLQQIGQLNGADWSDVAGAPTLAARVQLCHRHCGKGWATNFSEPGSDEALMKNQVTINHNMTGPRRIVAGVDASQAQVDPLKRLQADTAAELDALLPATLPPSPSFGGAGDHAWTRAQPARSGSALSFREMDSFVPTHSALRAFVRHGGTNSFSTPPRRFKSSRTLPTRSAQRRIVIMSNTKDPSSTTPESFPGVKWCHPVEKTQDGIEKILEFASENYTRHTEWFLKHRDQAYLQLGAVITAEFALANLPSTKASPLLSIIIWAIFMLLSVGFGAAGIVGCRQAFKAAMESIATMNKAMWAMGFAGRIFVNKHPPVATQIPMLPDDIYFLPRRWVELENADTTDAFVRSKIGGKDWRRVLANKRQHLLLGDHFHRNPGIGWICHRLGFSSASSACRKRA